MRNDTARWPAPHATGLHWQTEGLSLRHVLLERQTLISGTDVLHAFGPATGWPDPALGDDYAVALRRDRVLRVGGPAMAEGWDAERGHAVSDMTGGLAVYDLSGPCLADLLLRGADMQPSRSAMRLWAGLEVILYHHGFGANLRIHIARARADSLVETIKRRVEAMLRHTS